MTWNDSDPTPGRLPERPHPAPGDRRFVLNADGAAIVIQRGGQHRYLSGRLIVHPQWLDRLDMEASVWIRPDLVFESGGGEATYVADIKYKVTDDRFGREADYYRLLAYTTALELPEGLLIYCQNDGGTPPGKSRSATVEPG